MAMENYFIPSLQSYLQGSGLDVNNPASTYVNMANNVQDLQAKQAQLNQVIQNMKMQANPGAFPGSQAAANVLATTGQEQRASELAEEQTYTPAQANQMIRARLQASTAFSALSDGEKANMLKAIDDAYPPHISNEDQPGYRDISLQEIRDFETARLQRPTWVRGATFVPSSAQIKAQLTDATNQPLTVDQQYDTLMNADDPSQVKFIPAGTNISLANAKQQAATDKQWQIAKKDIIDTFTRFRSSAGVSMTNQLRALQKASGLLLTQPTINGATMKEIVMDIATALAGQTGTATEATRSDLGNAYTSLWGDLKAKGGYLSGMVTNVVSADQKQYLQGQITRLTEMIQGQLAQMVSQKQTEWSGPIQAHQDEWNTMKSELLTPGSPLVPSQAVDYNQMLGGMAGTRQEAAAVPSYMPSGAVLPQPVAPFTFQLPAQTPPQPVVQGEPSPQQVPSTGWGKIQRISQ